MRSSGATGENARSSQRGNYFSDKKAFKIPKVNAGSAPGARQLLEEQTSGAGSKTFLDWSGKMLPGDSGFLLWPLGHRMRSKPALSPRENEKINHQSLLRLAACVLHAHLHLRSWVSGSSSKQYMRVAVHQEQKEDILFPQVSLPVLLRYMTSKTVIYVKRHLTHCESIPNTELMKSPIPSKSDLCFGGWECKNT